ncbi:MAG: hypothetical protein HKN13_11175, partial [Rhodothermales bacterium]|nr:hypothetical protein [Rhodothermales bacterium]
MADSGIASGLATVGGRFAALGQACLSFVLVAVLAALLSTSASAQGNPEYEVDLISKATEQSSVSQVDIYTRIPFSKLRFLASPEGFTARYEVS